MAHEWNSSKCPSKNTTMNQTNCDRSYHKTPKLSSYILKHSPSPRSKGKFAMTSNNMECMHRSLPNLNFDMDDDNSFDFTEIDFNEFAVDSFHSSFSKTESPFFLEQNETPKTNKSSPAVKVKASQLKNMSVNEKEIKSLFKEWKCEQKKKSKPDELVTQVETGNKFKTATNSDCISPKKNKKTIRIPSHATKASSPACPIQHFNESFSNIGFDSDFFADDSEQVTSAGKKNTTNSPTRKKKIAVKLKASDLNISPEKKEEIEKLFWKWKGDVKDPSTVVPKIKPTVDPRWEVKKREVERPRPASRQRSSSLEPQDIDICPTEKRHGSTRLRSKSLGRDNAGMRPPSRRTSSGRLDEKFLVPSCRQVNSDETTLSSTDTSSSGSSTGSSLGTKERSKSVSRLFQRAHQHNDLNETRSINSSQSKESSSSAEPATGNARCKSRGRSRSCHRRREYPREQSDENRVYTALSVEENRDSVAAPPTKRSLSQRRRSFSRTSSRDGEKFNVQ